MNFKWLDESFFVLAVTLAFFGAMIWQLGRVGGTIVLLVCGSVALGYFMGRGRR